MLFHYLLACNFTEDELTSNFATLETKLTYQCVFIMTISEFVAESIIVLAFNTQHIRSGVKVEAFVQV